MGGEDWTRRTGRPGGGGRIRDERVGVREQRDGAQFRDGARGGDREVRVGRGGVRSSPRAGGASLSGARRVHGARRRRRIRTVAFARDHATRRRTPLHLPRRHVRARARARARAKRGIRGVGLARGGDPGRVVGVYSRVAGEGGGRLLLLLGGRFRRVRFRGVVRDDRKFVPRRRERARRRRRRRVHRGDGGDQQARLFHVCARGSGGATPRASEDGDRDRGAVGDDDGSDSDEEAVSEASADDWADDDAAFVPRARLRRRSP